MIDYKEEPNERRQKKSRQAEEFQRTEMCVSEKRICQKSIKLIMSVWDIYCRKIYKYYYRRRMLNMKIGTSWVSDYHMN